jgi:regulator of replication initiation timing
MSPSRIANWILRKPDRAVRVVLFTLDLGNEGASLAEWKSDCDANSISAEVCALAQDYADEQQTECRFALAWFDEEGTELNRWVIKTKARFAGAPSFQVSQDSAGVLNTSTRHIEAMARIYVGGMQSAMGTVTTTNAALRAENGELRHEIAALRAEVRALRELVDAQAADEAAEQSELMTKATDAFKTHILPAITEGVARAAAGTVNGHAANAGAADA